MLPNIRLLLVYLETSYRIRKHNYCTSLKHKIILDQR